MARYRAGCDIGGTFTDFVLLDEDSGAVRVGKRLTTPDDPSVALLAGFAAFEAEAPGYPRATARLAHATTLVANAVIERKGARTALLCTAGFRDVLELRRYVRVTTYELFADPPEPLVPRALRLPVHERIRADGSVLRAVEPQEIAAIADAFGKRASSRSRSASCMHLPTRRTSGRRRGSVGAPARNAGVAVFRGVAADQGIRAQLDDCRQRLCQAAGATLPPPGQRRGARSRLRRAAADHAVERRHRLAETAAEFPVRLIESGPVAGAIVARHFGALLGLPEVLSFDMGGTTAKACLIRDGQLPLTDELEVARSRRFTKSQRFPGATPAVNMIEIGAGGGSIAQIGALGIVQVGPESAGAAPGPACYGGGGTLPTVTDADLALGYLDPGALCRRHDAARREPARSARSNSTLGAPLGLEAVAAAWTVHDVVNETMATAVRMHVTERGGDPSRPVLVAFGGAGPVHVANLAASSASAGAGAVARGRAVGARAPAVSRRLRSEAHPQAAARAASTPRGAPRDRPDEAGDRRAARRGGARCTAALCRDAGVRLYRPGLSGAGTGCDQRARGLDAGTLLAAFAEVYRAKYGYYYDDVPAELVNILVAGHAGDTPDNHSALPETAGAMRRRAVLAGHGRRAGRQRSNSPSTTATRSAPGMAFAGPALIEEASATAVVDCDAAVRSRPLRLARDHIAGGAAMIGRLPLEIIWPRLIARCRRDGDDVVSHRLLA